MSDHQTNNRYPSAIQSVMKEEAKAHSQHQAEDRVREKRDRYADTMRQTLAHFATGLAASKE